MSKGDTDYLEEAEYNLERAENIPKTEPARVLMYAQLATAYTAMALIERLDALTGFGLEGKALRTTVDKSLWS